MLLLIFVMFLGTDILVKGRLAILSLIGIWTILTVRIMSKKRPRLWYLYTLNRAYYIIWRGLCLLFSHGSPEPQQGNKLKFPRLVFILLSLGIGKHKFYSYEKKQLLFFPFDAVYGYVIQQLCYII